MLYFLTFVSIIMNMVCVILPDGEKIKKLCLVFCFFLFFIVLGWSYGAHDVMVGINRYNDYLFYSSFTEIGYTMLIDIAHKMGMSYRQFFVICSLFETAIMFWFIGRNSKNSVIVVLLFTIYPFVIYFQFIRNILAFSFVLIGFDFLLNKRKNYIFWYLFMILIASTIHLNSIIFIIYLLLTALRKDKCILLSIILFLLLLFSESILNIFIKVVNMFLGQKKVDIIGNVSKAEGQFGRSFAIAFSILNFFVMYDVITKYGEVDIDDYSSELIYKINVFSIVFIPLTVNFGVGFARFPTMLTIVNYIYYVNWISMIDSQKKKSQVYFILIVFLVGLLFLNYRNEEYREAVLYPFFEQNELIK